MRTKCIVRSFQQRVASTGSPPRRGGVWGSGRAVAAQIKTVATPTGGDRPRRPSLAKALRQELPGEQGKGPSPGPQKRTSLGGRLLPSKPGSRTTRRKHDALRFSPDRPTSSRSAGAAGRGKGARHARRAGRELKTNGDRCPWTTDTVQAGLRKVRKIDDSQTVCKNV